MGEETQFGELNIDLHEADAEPAEPAAEADEGKADAEESDLGGWVIDFGSGDEEKK